MPRLIKAEWIELKPFSWTIWLTILLAFALFPLLLYFSSAQRKDPELLLMTVYGAYLNQCNLMAPFCKINVDVPFFSLPAAISSIKRSANLSTRLLFAVWILASFILVNVYSSSLHSFLTLPLLEPTIETLYDLRMAADTDTYKILTMKDSSDYSAFIKAPPEHGLFYAIGKHINRTGHKMFASEQEEFEMIEADKKVVAIDLKKQFIKTKKVYHFGKENLANVFTGIVLPKRSLLLKAFNSV